MTALHQQSACAYRLHSAAGVEMSHPFMPDNELEVMLPIAVLPAAVLRQELQPSPGVNSKLTCRRPKQTAAQQQEVCCYTVWCRFDKQAKCRLRPGKFWESVLPWSRRKPWLHRQRLATMKGTSTQMMMRMTLRSSPSGSPGKWRG